MSLQVRLLAPATATLVSSLALAGAGPAQAQHPRQLTVSRMEAEYADPFTCVHWGSLRELADGRLIVADPTEKRLELIDFRSGAGRPLGREGSGPGEWGLPLAVSSFGGDTTLLYDPANGRLLKIASDGGIADETIPLPSGRAGLSLMGARAYDAQGRLYFQGSAVTAEPGQPIVTADSAPIIRFDPRSTKVDTVAHIRVPKPDVQQSGGAGQGRIAISVSSNPFAPTSTWAVAPDGRVAIITPEPYRVEWIGANGRRTTGPVTPYERVRVSSDDRNATPSGPQCSFSISRNTGSGRVSFSTSISTSAGSGGNAPRPRTDWPEFKPPFLGSMGTPAVAAPSGEVWVPRATAAKDPVPSYDVFDAQGRLTARVSLPKGSRLLGFGRGVVYLSRMDEDDLVYIQKWRLPTG